MPLFNLAISIGLLFLFFSDAFVACFFLTVSYFYSCLFKFLSYRYYGYRNSVHEPDLRLKCFGQHPELFRDRDVLDIGCNVGHITLSASIILYSIS